MKTLDKELLVKKLTEMVEKGEEFVNFAKNVRKEFEEFDEEIMELIEEDPILVKLQDRIDNVISFITGDFEDEKDF